MYTDNETGNSYVQKEMFNVIPKIMRFHGWLSRKRWEADRKPPKGKKISKKIVIHWWSCTGKTLKGQDKNRRHREKYTPKNKAVQTRKDHKQHPKKTREKKY